MLTIGGIVIGVDDMARATAFWTGALGYVVAGGSNERWTTLNPAEGSGAVLYLQRSVTPVQPRPRLHLDLNVPDHAGQLAEVERLVGLGAQRVDWDSYPDDPDFVVLADTEGNVFCVVDESHVPVESRPDTEPG
jgi:hypothetical protein